MTIKVSFQPEDIINMRFGYSPLLELVLSYRLWQSPYYHSLYQSWMNVVGPELRGYEFPHMEALITPNYTADFLMPVPDIFVHNLADEIDWLKQTTDEKIHQQVLCLLEVNGDNFALQNFLTEPRQTLFTLIDELLVYWEIALAPYWRQMIGILDSEILRQAKLFALEGAPYALNELGHNSQYADGLMLIDKPSMPLVPNEYELSGNGFQLVPTIFKGHSTTHIRPDKHPMITYSARGAGLLKLEKATTIEKSLVLLVGEAKAKILTALLNPRHTQELALQLSLTSGAISQHLRSLKEIGLVESQRSGYYVYYRLSHRGQQLLELFSN